MGENKTRYEQHPFANKQSCTPIPIIVVPLNVFLETVLSSLICSSD